MKKVFLSILFVINVLSVQASNCSDSYFIEKHVVLNLCQNYGRGGKAPLYRGISKALNDYIALRIERGELEDKQFHIVLYDPILSNPQYSLTQSKKAYYIVGQHLSLNTLILLIDEFSKPDFTPVDFSLTGYED